VVRMNLQHLTIIFHHQFSKMSNNFKSSSKNNNKSSSRRNNRRGARTEHILTNRNMNPPIIPYKPLFPQRLRCQMKYTELVGYASTSVWSYYLRANSLFDPNASGVGYQPMWFDNMKAIYNSYCVLNARIQVQVINQSASPCRACATPMDDQSVPALSYQMQLPYSSYATVGAGVSGNSLAYLDTHVSCAQFAGYSNPTDANLRSLVTTSPTESIFFNLQFASTDATTLNLEIMYTIVFDTYFLDLVPTYDS
jgi:hypothetical protein